MSINYIEHNRELTKEEIEKHGKMATHDIEVPILLLYELGVIPDKNGNKVDINKDFINATMLATNDWIKKKAKSPFSVFKSAWNKPINEIEAIPIIKNHDTDDVDGIVGHIKGLLYTDVVDNKLALKGTAVIKDIKAKYKIKSDLLRNTSIGTRNDGSIKEVSFVINEAVSHGGLEMSENIKITNDVKSPLLDKKIELSIKLSELNNKIIPNHILLTKMIKQNKIEPFKYDTLINQEHQVIELMEKSISAVYVPKMYGSTMSTIKLQTTMLSEVKKGIEELEKKYNKETKDSTIDYQQIQPVINYDEMRNNELKQMLELMEYNPEVLTKYIKVELGEENVLNNNFDIELSEYLGEAEALKKEINNINIQLGEYNE